MLTEILQVLLCCSTPLLQPHMYIMANEHCEEMEFLPVYSTTTSIAMTSIGNEPSDVRLNSRLMQFQGSQEQIPWFTMSKSMFEDEMTLRFV